MILQVFSFTYIHRINFLNFTKQCVVQKVLTAILEYILQYMHNKFTKKCYRSSFILRKILNTLFIKNTFRKPLNYNRLLQVKKREEKVLKTPTPKPLFAIWPQAKQ